MPRPLGNDVRAVKIDVGEAFALSHQLQRRFLLLWNCRLAGGGMPRPYSAPPEDFAPSGPSLT